MATKLKNLRVKKVDFVDEGANPDSHIPLLKNKEGQSGKGTDEKSPSFIQKIFTFIGKAAGMGQDEIDSAMEEIAKGESESFCERYAEQKNRKIADEIWDICYALESSLISILNDDDLDSANAAAAMQESLDEFQKVCGDCVKQWSEGRTASVVSKNEVTEADVELMKAAVERLNGSIAKATGAEDKSNLEDVFDEEEGDEEMKIDKSKLSAGERAFLEEIEKKAGITETEDQAGSGDPQTTEPAAPDVQKSAAPEVKEITAPVKEATEEGGDIYKGIHPAIKAEIEALRKFREGVEDRELHEVAKRYEVIGKKADELVPTLKSLKAAGGTAYNDMIAVLDEAVTMVEKSGVFSEIGKSGHGSNEGSAWAEADAKAVELMKSKVGLTKAQAIDEVLQADAELAARCEKED